MIISKDLKIKIFKEYLPVSLMTISTLVFAILYKQAFIKVLPIFITIVVMLLNSRANRYGLLLGSINCCIYSIGHLMTGVYSTVASDLCQAGIAFVSFFLWRSRAYGNSTKFRSLKFPARLMLLGVILVSWMVAYFINSKVPDATLPIVDSLIFVLGIAVTILNMLAFVETPFINLISQILNMFLWIYVVIKQGLQDMTYVTSSLYSFYMVIIMCITYTKLYKKQQAEKHNTPTESSLENDCFDLASNE